MSQEPAGIAYDKRHAELRAAIAVLERGSSRISGLRGITFLLLLALIGYGIYRPLPAIGWAVAAAVGLTFAALVVRHAVLISRAAALEQRASVVRRALDRVEERFAEVPENGERFFVQGHPYARDLDLFGHASVFQMINTARTAPGEAALARWLSAPASAAEVALRQEAARELAGLDAFREDLAVLGLQAQGGAPAPGAAKSDGVTRDPILAWATTPPEKLPRPSATAATVARVLVAATVLLLVLGQVLGAERLGIFSRAWMVTVVAQVILLMSMRAVLERTVGVVASREAPFGKYRGLFERVERERFTSARLVDLQKRLHGTSGREASAEMRSLENIAGFAELRHNGIVHFVANVFLLWDVWCALALVRWHARAGARVQPWIAAIAEIEALASLGALARERPDWAWPVVDDEAPRFTAEALGHPLLPSDRRVSNDVALGRSTVALMITGSNMSGKSTLLRAIGVNAVLALAGAPVCARRLSLATMSVRTSMRLEDSLEHGVSHFYAELERLKMVVDAVDARERVLFLLDEVLHGTNSRERQIGAKAVIKHLIERGAIGAVSSHDLGLATLEDETGGKVVNVHFQELVADGKMTFDYLLKPGVVTTANALRLMKLVGIGVPLPDS
jgi:hypothetical protein